MLKNSEELQVIVTVTDLEGAVAYFNKHTAPLKGSYVYTEPLPQTGTPAQFGAKGDGIADDTQALIDWGNWAFSESKDLFLDENAIYKTSQSIKFDIKHEFTLDCKNAKILRDYEIQESNPFALHFSNGTKQNRKEAKENIKKGDNFIVLQDVEGIEVGDFIRLNGGVFVETEGYKANKGLSSLIIEIAGNVLFLADVAPLDYLASEIEWINISKPLDVVIKNLSFEGLNNLDQNKAGNSRHFKISGFNNAEIDNISFDSEGYAIMEVKNCYNGEFTNIKTTQGPTHKGVYGIMIFLSVNCNFENINIDSYSHSVTFTGTASYGCTFENIRTYTGTPETRSFASFDAHNATGITKVNNSEIFGAAWGNGTLEITNSIVRPEESNYCILSYRGVPDQREVFINIYDSQILSKGFLTRGLLNNAEIELGNGTLIKDCTFNNEDLVIDRVPTTRLVNNIMKLDNGTSYDIPNN